MVFKFKTVVVTLIAFAAILSGPAGHAQDTTTPSTPGYTGTVNNACDLERKNAWDANIALIDAKDEAAVQRAKKVLDVAEKARSECLQKFGTAGTGGDCGSASSSFGTTMEAFTAACGKANIAQGDSAESAANACAQEITRCGCGSNPNGPLCQGNEKESRRPRARGTSATGASLSKAELAAQKKRINYCPSAAGEGLDNLKAQVDDLNNSLPSRKEKIANLEEGIRQARIDNTTALAGVEEQMSTQKETYDQELKQLQESADQQTENLAQEALQLRGEISRLEAERRQADFEYSAASVRQKEAHAQAQLVCWESASSEIRKEQQYYIDNYRQPKGDFNSFMSNVGISNRAQWQRLARKRYEDCRKASPHQALLKTADEVFGQAKIAHDKALTDIAAAKALKENELAKVVAGDPCLNSGRAADNSIQGNKNCANAQKLLADRASADQRNSTEMQRLAAQYQKTAQAQSASMVAQTKMLSDAQRDLADEQSRLANYRELLALKQEAAGDIPVTSEESKEARAQFAKLKSVADRVVSCNPAGSCVPGTSCFTASRFLESVGISPPEHIAVESYGDEQMGKYATSPANDAPASATGVVATPAGNSRVPATSNPDGQEGAAESSQPAHYPLQIGQ